MTLRRCSGGHGAVTIAIANKAGPPRLISQQRHHGYAKLDARGWEETGGKSRERCTPRSAAESLPASKVAACMQAKAGMRGAGESRGSPRGSGDERL